LVACAPETSFAGSSVLVDTEEALGVNWLTAGSWRIGFTSFEESAKDWSVQEQHKASATWARGSWRRDAYTRRARRLVRPGILAAPSTNSLSG